MKISFLQHNVTGKLLGEQNGMPKDMPTQPFLPTNVNEKGAVSQPVTPEVSVPTTLPDVAHDLGMTAAAPTVELPTPVETPTEAK